VRDLTVTNQWKIVVKGLDGRYHEVFIDPQGDFGHARSLAKAYATLDPDRPEFVPDARVIREGAVVGLLDALLGILRAPGDPGALVAARRAVSAATDPHFNTELTETDAVTMETIREASRAGGAAFLVGTPRAAVPQEFAPWSALEIAWGKGWDAAALQPKP
jgi:hypothetical protein